MSSFLRALVLFGPTAALLIWIGLANLHAYPGSVAQTTPVASPAVQRTSTVASGSHSVSSQTGAAQYSFPINVPRGRRGLEPKLQLSYSSQNPLRGGVAAGWSMAIPQIRVDTSAGRARGPRYISTLSGGQPLVRVDEPGAYPDVHAYRVAENDGSYTRYEHTGDHPGVWRAMTSDGLTLTFGDDSFARDSATPGGSGTEARWFLTHINDRFGNDVWFQYEKVRGAAHNGRLTDVPIDIALTRVLYNRNIAAGVSPHARVEFVYADELDTCPGSNVPIGAHFDYRTGIRIYEGAKRLDRVDVWVDNGTGWQKRREIALRYDTDHMDCGQQYAPLRVLEAIDEKAISPEGIETRAPTISFEYGRLQHDFAADRQLTKETGHPLTVDLGSGHHGLSLATPGSYPTTDSMLLDVDGDGRQDIVRSAPLDDDHQCEMTWRRNLGGGAFGPRTAKGLGTMPWLSPGDTREGCSLAGQFSRRMTLDAIARHRQCGSPANYVGFHFLDIDGDRIPEQVTSMNFNKGTYRPEHDADLAPWLDFSGSLPGDPGCHTGDGAEVPCLLDPLFGLDPDADILAADAPLADLGVSCDTDECEAPPSCWDAFKWAEGEFLWDHEKAERRAAAKALCCGPTYCGEWETGTDEVGTLWSPPIPKPLGDGFSFLGPPSRYGEVGGESFPPPRINAKCTQIPEMDAAAYVLRVHQDEGDTYATVPMARRVPAPFESDRPVDDLGGTEAVTGSAWHTIIDIDGDGLLDQVFRHPRWLVPDFGSEWNGELFVFLGDGSGNFGGPTAGKALLWTVPRMDVDSRIGSSWSNRATSGTAGVPHRTTDTRNTLQDINGDGLPDYVVSRNVAGGADVLRVYYNTGTGFEAATAPGTEGGTVLSDHLTTLASSVEVNLEDLPIDREAFSWVMNNVRTLDADQDGRPDVFSLALPEPSQYNPWAHPAPVITTYKNLGDRLVPAAPREDADLYAAIARFTLNTPDRWWVRTDMVDIDGDGMLDQLSGRRSDGATCDVGTDDPSYAMWGLCGFTPVYSSDHDAAQGMRLLKRVDNGRGATVEFTYAPSSDSEAVKTGAGYRTASPLWVVREVTVADEVSGASGTTTYEYRNPVSNFDRFRRFGFRGFESVDAVGPANDRGIRSKTRSLFDYDMDRSGRQVGTQSFVECSPEARDTIADCLATISETTWQRHVLFDDQVVSYQRAEHSKWVCPTGLSENQADDCRSAGHLKRTVYGWGPLYADGSAFDGESTESQSEPQWFVATSPLAPRTLPAEPRETEGISLQPIETFTSDATLSPDDPVIDPRPEPVGTSYLCGSGPDTLPVGYVRVMYVQCGSRTTESAGAVIEGDRGATHRHRLDYNEYTYHILPVESRKYLATSDGGEESWGTVKLVGRHEFVRDERGLAKEMHEWIDESTAAITAQTFNTTLGLLVSVQKPRQYGSTVRTVFDYDAKFVNVDQTTNELGQVRRIATDLATGATLRTEGPQQPDGFWPGDRMEYDGFGRPLRSYRQIDAAGGGYEEVLIGTSKYHDDEIPARIVQKARVDYDIDEWRTTTMHVDGLGRPTKLTVGDAAGSTETRYRYDNAGALVARLTPNPRDDGASDVETSWQHDAVGRTVVAVPPSGASLHTEFDGLTVRRTQRPDDGSVPRPVELYYDVFGRLRSVVEAGPAGDALTVYEYDANDNLVLVENADGIVTEMEHDLVGRRTAIHRAGRTWSYRYDANGNLIEARDPMPDGALGWWYYATLMGYDHLDRPTIRWVGWRDLSPAERAELANDNQVTYFWYDDVDSSGKPHSVGRLTRVDSPIGSVEYTYSAEGWLVDERRQFEVQPAFTTAPLTDERTITRRYNAFGQPVSTTHADDPLAPTITTLRYDERGLPVELLAEGGTSLSPETALTTLTRNRAGMVTERSDGHGFQGQTWTYDDLGRVVDHQILARTCFELSEIGCAPTPVAGETLTYNEVGNLEQQVHKATGVTLSFAYDSQHQLVSASAGDGRTYSADFSYSAAGRLLTVNASSMDRRVDVAARDVVYDYTTPPGSTVADPEAVRSLRDVTTDASVGDFEYDASGNLVRKHVDGKTWLFRYDGNHELRRACLMPDGSCEVYYYDHTGARTIAARTAFDADEPRARFWFGDTEIEYRSPRGAEWSQDRSLVHARLGAMPAARIVDGDIEDPQFVYSGVLSHLLAVVDVGGGLVARYSYSPFGELLYEEGIESTDFRRQFNGKELDELTELSYYGVRYYDRYTLTWSQRDPMYAFAPDLAYDEPRRMGLYTFVLNNPLRYVDPDGRDGEQQIRNIAIEKGSLEFLEYRDDVPQEVDGYIYAGEWRYINLETRKEEVGSRYIHMSSEEAAVEVPLLALHNSVAKKIEYESGLARVASKVTGFLEWASMVPVLGDVIDLAMPVVYAVQGRWDDVWIAGGAIFAVGVSTGWIKNADELIPGGGGGGPTIRSRYGDGVPIYNGQQPARISGPDSDALGPHSVLRNDSVNDRIYQAREFDGAGNPVRDVDFTSPTYPNGRIRPDHAPAPHQHRWEVNDPAVGPKSGYKRSRKGEPL